jgi:hypothetical protein
MGILNKNLWYGVRHVDRGGVDQQTRRTRQSLTPNLSTLVTERDINPDNIESIKLWVVEMR